MSAENRVPAIRFKGFDGEWVEKCLGEIGSLKNGMNFDKTAMGLGHPFVNLQDVFGKNEVSNVNLGLAFSTVNQRKEYSLNEGDVLFIRSSVKPEGVGEAAVISKSLENTTYSGFIIRFRPNIEMDVNFNRFVYSTTNSRRQILASSTSSANSNVNQDSLQRIQLALPGREEQTKIGNYFQQLDTLIAQHQQKQNKLLNLKKALLEKMFPKQGATVPEIRFKGFSGEWEEKAVGEDMNVTSVKRIHQSDWTASGVRFLRARDIVSAHKNEEPSDYLYITKEKYTEYSLLSGKVQPGDLLVTGVGTIGIPMLIANDEPVYFKDGNIIWFKNENKIDGMFLFYSFKHDGIQNFIKISAGTGTVGTYTIDSGKKTPIKLPEKNEQTKIGKIFKHLDTLITQHQAQLKKLNNIKQACLEKMFV